MGKSSRGHLRLLQANPSMWGPQFEGFLQAQYLCSTELEDWDIVMMVEHHLGAGDLRRAAKRLAFKGMRLVASPARPKHLGNSGGAAIVVKSHLACWPIRGSPCIAEGPALMGHGHD